MPDYLQEHYSHSDEESRLLSRHGQVEYLTTLRYVERYLFPGAKILEIGAGTGRYSHALAKQGYAVDALEPVPYHIEIFQSKITPEEKISIRQGNARDLSAFADDAYDLILLLGPLYHLFTAEDKRQAIREALRVTKPGGLVFAAYCVADASILNYGFKKGNIHRLLEPNDFCGLTMPGYKPWSTPKSVIEIVRKEDIDALMTGFPVERLHYVATDLFTEHLSETVDAMDDATFEVYLNYHFFLCERPDMLGITHHSLDIFRKEGAT